jgi:LysM repeat protein
MKKILFLTVFLTGFTVAFSQSDFIVQHTDKETYLIHKVAPKENFFSVGRLYNLPPNEIANYNKLDMAKGLIIGQAIRIPLNASNFSQKVEKGKEVYYVVGEKEGLYRVSVKNNGVLMADLRKWNHLASDNITTGKKLIVGFIVNGETQTAVAAAPVEKAEKPIEKAEAKKEVAEIPKKEEVVVQKTEPEKKPEPVIEKKSPAPVQQVAVNDGNGGYFKSLFEKQVKSNPISSNETVSAGIFKTSSGWQDAKYYVLMDKVEPGTIVKIINPSNNKAVYAKVLGEMSGIRQNMGFDLRMSNAAASALDVTDADKFIVKVNY